MGKRVGTWAYLRKVYDILNAVDTYTKRIFSRNDVPKYVKYPTMTVYRILADLRKRGLIRYEQTRWGQKPVLTETGRKMKEVLGLVFKE